MNKASIIIVTAFITFLCTSVIWFGIGVFSYKLWMSEDSWLADDAFEVDLDAPTEVQQNEVFKMKVTASNSKEEPVTLDSIDIYDSFLEGFEVVSVSPKPKDESGLFGFRSFYFNGLRLKPGDSTTVTFELKAVKVGEWEGDLDCCTPMQSFTSKTAAITVTGPEDQ